MPEPGGTDFDRDRQERQAREAREGRLGQRSRDTRLGAGFGSDFGGPFKNRNKDEGPTPAEAAREAQLQLLSLLASQGRRATLLTGARGSTSGTLSRPTLLTG